MSTIHTDTATGRRYFVGDDGQSQWLDPVPGHARFQPATQPAAGPTLLDRPAPARKGARRWLIPAGTGLLGLIVGAGLGGSGAQPATVTAAGATVTQTATETVTATAPAVEAAPAPAESTPAPVDSSDVAGDGTFLVGTDIKPGTYRSAKPASGNCYWARLRADDGGINDIIANNNSSGPSVVTVRKSDKLFKTQGCEDWTRAK